MTEDRAPVSSICSNDDSFVVLERFTEENSNTDSQQISIIHNSPTPILSLAMDESIGTGTDERKNSQVCFKSCNLFLLLVV